jgi:hypothetical protein
MVFDCFSVAPFSFLKTLPIAFLEVSFLAKFEIPFFSSKGEGADLGVSDCAIAVMSIFSLSDLQGFGDGKVKNPFIPAIFLSFNDNISPGFL